MQRSLLALLFLCSFSPLASGTTYVVRPDGTGDFPTIQAAINAVQNGDTIELGDGIFQGGGNREISFQGKAITVRSRSGNAGACVIDCDGYAGFRFWDLETRDSILERIGITDSGEDAFSCSISCAGGSPIVRGCVLSGNQWAFFTEGASPRIENSVITGNGSGVWCGLMGPLSNVEIVGTTIAGNGHGMGIAELGGDVFLERCILWGNCLYDISVSAFGEARAHLTCCVVDSTNIDDPGDGWIGYVADNVFVNPIFCDPASCEDAPTADGDYHVDAASMCLPGASPCGELIGALGQGCSGTVPTQETTWGRIKARFR